jgi:hypothetical protein
VSVRLIRDRTLDEYTQSHWFLEGLPKVVRDRVTRKGLVNIASPDTMRFDKLLKIIKERADTREVINKFDTLPAAQDVMNTLVDSTTMLSTDPIKPN